jgi:hypothetical protein
MEYYIVVKDVKVKEEEEAIYDECNDDSCKACFGHNLVIVVKLEDFASILTSGDVNYSD